MSNRPANTIATLTICYEDSGGSVTQRGISVTEFDSQEMYGLCHLRESYRTFLYERVTSCVDVQTGEIVNDVQAHLWAIYEKSPRHALDMLYRNHLEVLQVLLYVGKADGQLRAAERKVMAAACKVITGDVRITEDMANDLLDSISVPSLHGFKIATGKVASRGNQTTMKRLLIACRTIVGTQKAVSPGEQEALDYIAKRFQLN